MAKRFTDTDKWKRSWFRGLPASHKVVWFYLLDQCDHAGVWLTDFDLLAFQTGTAFDHQSFQATFGDKVQRIEEDKYFIPSFVEFQYGELNPGNNAHKAVIKVLDRINEGPYKPLNSPSRGAQDKEQDKDKEKDKDQEKEGGVGGFAPQAVISGEVAACMDEWRTTLKHFGIERGLGQRDQIEIARAVQAYGSDWVLKALAGARKQKASKNWDPKQFVSLRIYLHKDRIERLVNIGAGKETAEGFDWSAFLGGEKSA